MNNNTQPTILELDDGSVGYFYSLNQLEEIRNKKMFNMNDEQVNRNFNRHSWSAIEYIPKGNNGQQ